MWSYAPPQTIQTVTRMLSVKLTPEEREALGVKLATAIQDLATKVLANKGARDQMKADESLLAATIQSLSFPVKTGAEIRPVEVEVQLLDGDRVQEIRLDTGEIVVTRVAYPSEQQLALMAQDVRVTAKG